MHLESLSLRGFKSFERRVELRFDRHLTAVVGPNGSGKSNIADAIRWVLGEQSMQALRSKNLVDLIFAGTDRRLPVNVAEVVLTVNNEDGTLPLPYAQVAVTRRAYRAGESEFFINGVPCRLKEIHQIFLDTGVGRRGVSLVGQGEIDALLTATPEQRRGWVEDLAGIARYQLQKEQALAKVEAARQELTRLQDVIVEVRGQRDRLQAEALRARRHRELAARLRSAEWRLYLLARRAAEARVAEAEARLQGLREELEAAQRAHAQATVESETLRSRAGGLRAEVLEGDAEERALGERMAYLGREEGVLGVERRQAAERLWRARGALRRLRAEAAGRAASRREARRARAEAASRLAHAEERLRRAEAELAEARRAAEDPTGTSGDLPALRARAAQLRESLAAREAEGRALAREIEERQHERERAASRLAALEEALARASDGHRARAAEEGHLKAELDRRREALAAAERAAEEAVRAQSRLDREAEALRARLGSLRQLLAEGQGYSTGPRLVLQHRERFPGLVGSVAELLRVPAELARAAEAALGGAGQHLVTRDAGAVQAAIAWLKAGGRGRATFLPMDRLRAASPLPAHHPARRHPGVLGLMAEMAGVQEGFETLLTYLLGRTLVLDGLESALDLQKSPDMPGGGGARLVTLEGELLLPSGAVTGGASRQEAGGLISRQSEVADLEARVAQAAAAQAEAAAREEAAREAERAARAARDRAEDAWRQAATARSAAAQEEERLRREVAAQGAQVEEARSVHRAREAAAARLREQVEEAGRQLAGLEQELAQAEGDAARLEEARQAARATAEAALGAVGEARLARQEAAHQWQEAARRLEEERQAWRAWRDRLEQAAAELQDGGAGRQALTRRREDLRRERAAVEEALAGIRGRVEARRAELGRLEQALEEKERRLAETAGGVEAVRGTAHAAELELVRERSELEHLLRDAPEPPEEAELAPGPGGAEAAAAGEPGAGPDLDRLRGEVERMRVALARLGPVNPVAEEAFQEVDTRFRTLEAQRDDLIAARRELVEMVETIDRTSTERFQTAFASLQQAMQELFERLFDGGEARLELTRPDDPLHSGVELNVRPPGKRWQPLMALSGGERSLCLVALLFAIQRVRPSAFALLDEVDAALDRRNLVRFVSVLEEFSARTQFVLISHRPETVEAAGVLYGATLDGDGTSRLVSLRVPEAEGVSR
ncbi:chromosome segregation protein SMC [Limnochorda pilosa]|uniref:Chromosome partition protein Smc n=1 Tax=Limnochorda pilosa TaxID=1555112 RepID=A0A0K2SK27_LIMPI|nr:chromosome segregation protein SMC [Limnochorda pilosa]BAS27471.1 chromosome segregation protein SMC [Limnochorda pilosa]